MKDNSNKITSTGTTSSNGSCIMRQSQCPDTITTILQQQHQQHPQQPIEQIQQIRVHEKNQQHPLNHLYTILNTISIENVYHIVQTNEYQKFCKIIYNQIQLQQLQQNSNNTNEAARTITTTTLSTTSSSFIDNHNNTNSSIITNNNHSTSSSSNNNQNNSCMVICDEDYLDCSMNNTSTVNDDIEVDNDSNMDHNTIIIPISPDSYNWKRKKQDELEQQQLPQPQPVLLSSTSECSSSSTCTAGISHSNCIESLSSSSSTSNISSSLSFIQNIIADEIILKILDFLHCIELIKIRSTCTRINKLVLCNVNERIHDFTIRRQLLQPLQLLRAQEQIHGINTSCNNNNNNYYSTIPYVTIPVLLLSRRIIITQCGDTEYNGIYYCTGINGNGYVFTKPRYQRDIINTTTSTETSTTSTSTESTVPTTAAASTSSVPAILPPNLSNVNLIRSQNDTEVTETDQALRCIIARRFSRETILWYLSKEMIRSDDNNNSNESDQSSIGTTETDNASWSTISASISTTSTSSNISSSLVLQEEVINYEVYQTYSFWANLADAGDTTPDISQYPSQTSTLRRNDPSSGWQQLSNTRLIHPPIVELLP